MKLIFYLLLFHTGTTRYCYQTRQGTQRTNPFCLNWYRRRRPQKNFGIFRHEGRWIARHENHQIGWGNLTNFFCFIYFMREWKPKLLILFFYSQSDEAQVIIKWLWLGKKKIIRCWAKNIIWCRVLYQIVCEICIYDFFLFLKFFKILQTSKLMVGKFQNECLKSSHCIAQNMNEKN